MAVETTVKEAPRARAIRKIRQWIETEELPPGSVLPAERALSQRAGVGLSTMQRALHLLEEEGLIERRSPRTRVVAQDRPDAGTTKLLADTVALVSSKLEASPAHQSSGWADNVPPGSVQELQNRELNTLCLHSGSLSAAVCESIRRLQPYGVLVFGLAADGSHVPFLEDLRDNGIPPVIFSHGEAYADFDRVDSDHAAGAERLAEWLIGCGCQRLGLLLPQDPDRRSWAEQRRVGCRRALDAAGLEPETLITFAGLDLQHLPNAERFRVQVDYMKGCLHQALTGDNAIDALMLSSDFRLGAVASACRALGREPNSDLPIAGYDNTWIDTEDREFDDTAPVATVDKMNFEIGSAMARLLIDRVEGDLPEEPQHRMVQPRLVIVNNQWGS